FSVLLYDCAFCVVQASNIYIANGFRCVRMEATPSNVPSPGNMARLFESRDHGRNTEGVVVPSILDAGLHLSVYVGAPAGVTQKGGQHSSFFLFCLFLVLH
ncbi:unnamed protein product, partial [Sphacelaria rigidula]